MDESENVKDIVLDYKNHQEIEEALLDEGMANAMKESADDEEIDLEAARSIVGKIAA